MHCGDLNGKEIQKRGDICICIADSFCCTVETNTTLGFPGGTVVKNPPANAGDTGLGRSHMPRSN